MTPLISFIIFLTVFLSLYGLLHYYFYRKLTGVVRLRPAYGIAVAAVLVLLLSFPIVSNIAARADLPSFAAFTAFTGYIWMGFIFLFFSTHLLFDLHTVTMLACSRIFRFSTEAFRPARRVSFAAVLLITTAVTLYGLVEARSIRVERVVLKTGNMPSGVEPIRIVQIADMHLGAINGQEMARRVVGIIKELDPHILVSTGDLVDRGIHDADSVAETLKGIEAPYGKYAVMGNHEFYAGVKGATAFTRRAGFRMLRNEGVVAGGMVNVAGVDDPAGKRLGLRASSTEEEVLDRLSRRRPTILLKHQPRVNEGSRGMFDLQLSGHTHKGQIFPFSLVTSLVFPFHSGFFELDHNAGLYVSRGTGTWGPPLRFLAPPEITLIELRSAL
jgi:uncharacterized protein